MPTVNVWPRVPKIKLKPFLAGGFSVSGGHHEPWLAHSAFAARMAQDTLAHSRARRIPLLPLWGRWVPEGGPHRPGEPRWRR